jgi:PIN domain nuclease of toxin-antitoxin system
VSPISFLEIQFLAEVGRLEVRQAEFMDAVSRDQRFVIDEVPLVPLIEKAMQLVWTRDPFDRLLAAHSEARRVPLCSIDRVIRAEHRLMVPELS